MLTRDQRDKWAAALRSGKFQQAHGILHINSNRYCCLGVLCIVLNKRISYASILEIRNDSGTLTKRQQNEFIRFNDTLILNFDQIANEVDKLLVSDQIPPSQEGGLTIGF